MLYLPRFFATWVEQFDIVERPFTTSVVSVSIHLNPPFREIVHEANNPPQTVWCNRFLPDNYFSATHLDPPFLGSRV